MNQQKWINILRQVPLNTSAFFEWLPSDQTISLVHSWEETLSSLYAHYNCVGIFDWSAYIGLAIFLLNESLDLEKHIIKENFVIMLKFHIFLSVQSEQLAQKSRASRKPGTSHSVTSFTEHASCKQRVGCWTFRKAMNVLREFCFPCTVFIFLALSTNESFCLMKSFISTVQLQQ